MDEQRDNTPSVPYYAFESVVSIYERHNKRLFIALVLAIVLFFASNAMWLYVWNQYDYVDETYSDDYVQTVDGKFNLNVGEQGDISYGNAEVQKDLPEADDDTQ